MLKIKMKSLSAGPNGVFPAGQIREVDEKEGKSLIKGGYADEVIEVNDNKPETENTSLNVDDYHVGGGYYDLPNGDKVRGKEKAEEVLKELEKVGDE